MVPAAMAAGGAGAMFISQVLAFAILLIVAFKLIIPALGKIVGARTRSIEDTFGKLERETAEAKRQVEDLKRRMAGLEQESRERLEKALAEAAATRDRALSDAQAQAKAAAARARQEAAIERDKAVLELRQAATELTLQAAAHLTRSVMDDGMQGHLVDTYLTQLETVKRT